MREPNSIVLQLDDPGYGCLVEMPPGKSAVVLELLEHRGRRIGQQRGRLENVEHGRSETPKPVGRQPFERRGKSKMPGRVTQGARPATGPGPPARGLR